MSNFFFASLWTGLLIWSLLYISDYAFTVVCARLYRRGPDKIVVFEGSYELNPVFQKDINSLRVISPRFIAMLVLSNLVLAWIWFFFSRAELNLYPFTLGAFVLLELSVHVRHLRNFFMFKALMRPNLIRGRIEYPRPHSLRMSAIELFSFGFLYLFVFAFVPSSFLVGGTFSCVMTGIAHRKLARKAETAKSPPLQ